jgi:DivIVA domain-containing protein
VVERERDRTERGGVEPVFTPAPSGTASGGVPEELRDVSFHTGVRGYDRREVDRYVQRVNRVIAELEIASSPQSAVRHALDRVGEQTSGILQRARDTADEISHTANSEAEETVARAKAQVGEINADARAEADRILADAELQLTRAKSEADEIVAKATKQAEEILVRADSQNLERRAREEQRLDELRLHAENEMEGLRAETEAVETEHRLVLDRVQELAARLEELVESRRTTLEPEPAQDLDAGRGGEPAAAGDDVAGDAV